MENIKQTTNAAYKAVVYDNFGGVPLIVSFIGDEWMVTTPGEKFQPLAEYIDYEGDGFCFLCEVGDKVGALALAKMLGKGLENPEECVDETFYHRLERLKRLGVTLDVKDESLQLKLDTIANAERSCRHGNYSILCYLDGNYCEMLFDIDAFETREDAEEWAGYYFAALKKIGVEFKIV